MYTYTNIYIYIYSRDLSLAIWHPSVIVKKHVFFCDRPQNVCSFGETRKEENIFRATHLAGDCILNGGYGYRETNGLKNSLEKSGKERTRFT